MADVEKVMKQLKDNQVKFVDLRFTDSHGKWQHTTQVVETMDEAAFADGIMFDGSSIAGWKGINESDMILMPDSSTAVMDPFAAQPTMIVVCDVIEPSTGQGYSRDPRSVAKRSEAYLKASGIGDTAFFGPEAEFFVFDDVRYDVQMKGCFVNFESEDAPWSTGKKFELGNRGHRSQVKGGYFPVPPMDAGQDLRAEMLSFIKEMGVEVEKHHHEVAPSQHELGIKISYAEYPTLDVVCAVNLEVTYTPKFIGEHASNQKITCGIPWSVMIPPAKDIFGQDAYTDVNLGET